MRYFIIFCFAVLQNCSLITKRLLIIHHEIFKVKLTISKKNHGHIHRTKKGEGKRVYKIRNITILIFVHLLGR